MQVNSAQDYLTRHKRRVIAATYHRIPPPQSLRSNSLYLSAMANGDTQRERNVYPFQGANGGASGGAIYTSACCLVSGPIGVFSTTTTRGVVRFNVIPAMSVRATSVIT